jgi:phosphonate transport system substrate-binding protein
MSDATPSAGPSFSVGRVLLVAVPLALIMWGANRIYSSNVQNEAEQELRRSSVSGLLGDHADLAALSKDYKDADGDLLADAPADADCVAPEELAFSYVAASDASGEQETWTELLEAFKKKLGRQVTLVSYADTAEQMRALKDGTLHITAFSTGETPGAVNEAGFIPVASFADQNDDYRYTMKIIVPADSAVKKVEDLKGGRFTFVRPRSNSGCTAALVMLMKKHDLQPERDYKWGFSYGHDKSIEGIAAKRFEAAAVASDILAQMVADGKVAEDSIRVIYESEPYPPAVVGYAYNLTPELCDGIEQTLLEFDWKGSGLEKKYGPAGSVKFAAVNFKNDWTPVRDIRQSGSEMLTQLGAK